MKMKCKTCKYYYRTMSSGQGYNPAPYCHLYEDTGKRPNALTQECFAKKKKIKECSEEVYNEYN